MRVSVLVATLLVLSESLSACGISARPDLPYRMLRKAKTAVAPPPGFIYSHYKAPLDVGPGTIGPKKGTATVHQIGLPPIPVTGLATGLDLFSWGDASVKAAAENGGIRKVDQIEYDYRVILMFYREFTTEVYGE